ncbi:MAG: hypothetical protein O3A93_11210 [Chloroflexi bacterium]|nr:hypothetical protein [Chloroflexota bacterium]MDA1271808.1 hypothetical protein [Chloroflexota bacterium]
MVNSEKWLKLFDNFITDKVVQLQEEFSGIRSPCDLPVYLQDYLMGKVQLRIDLHVLRNGNTHELKIMVQGHGTKPLADTTSLDIQHGVIANCCDNHRGAMLVIVPESVENPERMVLRIPSVVRLELLDNFQSLGGQERQGVGLVGEQGGEVFAMNSYGKGNSVRSSMFLSELPNNVIDHRPQVMNTFSENEPEASRSVFDNFDMDFEPIIINTRLDLGNHLVRGWFKEIPGYTVEIGDILPCPLDAKAKGIHIISHKLRLPSYEQKETRDAENPEGPRDSCAYKEEFETNLDKVAETKSPTRRSNKS